MRTLRGAPLKSRVTDAAGSTGARPLSLFEVDDLADATTQPEPAFSPDRW
jgi:hypothetical protein